MAARTPEKLGPSPEVRVGRWHEFDVAAFDLLYRIRALIETDGVKALDP